MTGVLRNIYAGWLKLGLAIGKVTNPIIITALYTLLILPIALAMKLVGKDPMQRRWDKAATSYWIPRSTTHSMKDPF